MKNITFVLATLFSLSCYGKEIALTFDDCPRKTSPLMTGMERAKKLVDQLKAAKVEQVAFFCNSPTREPDGPERLKYFADRGHLIANHTADHISADKVPVNEFTANIDRAHEELKNLPNYRKWFRFPYLHEGNDADKVRAIREHLRKIGYTAGYVSADTQEWYMDDLLVRKIAEGKNFEQAKLCEVYKGIMQEEADFYDNMSRKTLKRSAKQVMLLHETDLNALCIGEVIAGLREKGWTIISPEEAYKDPIAKQEPRATTKLNQGRIFALAKEKGYRGKMWSHWNEEANIDKAFASVWK